MATGKALNGKPYAGNPHVRFDEGEVASAATPRRGSLLYEITRSTFLKGLFSAFGACGGRIFAAPPGWKPPKNIPAVGAKVVAAAQAVSYRLGYG